MKTRINTNTVWTTVNNTAEVYTLSPTEVTIKTRNACAIQLLEGDITTLNTDALVISTNPYLQMCSGTARTVRELGGMEIQEECDQIGYASAGEAVITSGGALNAQYVIHAVGPLDCDPNSKRKLISATKACLELADKHNLKSIAFPGISTELYDYPLDKCAFVMLSAVIDYLRNTDTELEHVVFCLPDTETLSVFETQLDVRFATNVMFDLAERWARGD